MAQEAAALLARHAFMKSQRDMFVKAMFECDLCNMVTPSRESFESHMKTHGKFIHVSAIYIDSFLKHKKKLFPKIMWNLMKLKVLFLKSRVL